MRRRLAAVILAAGASHRYQDGNKLLAQLGNGSPLIRVVAEHVTQSGFAETIVVTGNARRAIEVALEGLALRFVHNEDWSDGIGSSISLGISSVGPAVQGAFVILGDMPFVDRELLNALAKAFERTDGEGIVFPESPNGAQRNPVLWPQRFFPDLEQLRGDEGGKSLLARHGSWCTAVGGYSETTFHDVDTLDDLCAIRRISR